MRICENDETWSICDQRRYLKCMHDHAGCCLHTRNEVHRANKNENTFLNYLQLKINVLNKWCL